MSFLHSPLSLASLHKHMVPIEGGTFQMAKNYEVTLTQFEICRYPVTQSLWREVMGSDPEELHFTGSDRPVESVHWYEAVSFCNLLSEILGEEPAYYIDPHTEDPHNKSSKDYLKWSVSLIPGAKGYRLPTEAEWEYAARGGKYDRGFEYSGSADLDEVGWSNDNSYDETQPAGLKAPNALGLCDLSGNVWEWCHDWLSDDPSGQQSDPIGPASGVNRVSRGGSWLDRAAGARVSLRGCWRPDDRFSFLGFRLARTL